MDINQRARQATVQKPKNISLNILKHTKKFQKKQSVSICSLKFFSKDEKNQRYYNAKRTSLFIGKVIQFLKTVGIYTQQRGDNEQTLNLSDKKSNAPLSNMVETCSTQNHINLNDHTSCLLHAPLHSITFSDEDHNYFKIQERIRRPKPNFHTHVSQYFSPTKKRGPKDHVLSKQEKGHLQIKRHLDDFQQENKALHCKANDVSEGVGNESCEIYGSNLHEFRYLSEHSLQTKSLSKVINEDNHDERRNHNEIKKNIKKQIFNKQAELNEPIITIPIGRKFKLITLNNRKSNQRTCRSIWIRIDNVPEDIDMIKINSDMTKVTAQPKRNLSMQYPVTKIKNCSSPRTGNQLFKSIDEHVQKFPLNDSHCHPKRRIWENLPKDKTEILENVLAFKETVKEFRESKEKLQKQIYLRSGKRLKIQ